MNSPVLKSANRNPLNTSFGSAARADIAPEGSRQAFIGKLGKSVGNKLGLITAITSLGTAAVSQKTDGAIVMTAADVPASQALGAAQNDTVWYKGTVGSNSVYASGTLIRGKDADYVLTVAHAIQFPQGTISTTNMTIGNGTSYINDLGLTAGVASMYISPTYVPGSDSGFDYAFLRLNTRISSPDLVFTLGSAPQLGESILFAGFGLPSSMQSGSLPNTGNVMGFYASYNPRQPPGWNEGDDSGFFTGQDNSGVANTIDSGGPVKRFNAATGKWENIGSMVGSDFGDTTTYFGFYNGDQNFNNYMENIVQPVIPEPSITGLLGLSAIAAAMRRKRKNDKAV